MAKMNFSVISLYSLVTISCVLMVIADYLMLIALAIDLAVTLPKKLMLESLLVLLFGVLCH